MSTLNHFGGGNWGLKLFLVVTVGEVLTSSTAWLILRQLAGKAALRHLVLYSALICCPTFPVAGWLCSATGLESFNGFTELRQLDLGGTKVTDHGLAHLKDLTELQSLLIINTPVTDAGLIHLTGLARLQRLYVRDTKVTIQGITEIQNALPKLQVFQ